jgi:hypothetical protein
MGRKTRLVAVVALAAASATVMAGCRVATPPRDAARAADFTINKIADQAGAAFTVTGNVVGNKNLEVVTTSFNFTPPVGGPPAPLPGSVTLHVGSGTTWAPTTIVPTSEGIFGPNEPTITDVDGDGLNDVIIPSGYFFTRVSAPSITGSITWWKNNGDGTFARNDITTGVRGSFHTAIHTDFDGDGVKDIVTTFEDGGWPSYPFGTVPPPFVSVAKPVAKVQYFKGLGGGTFGPAIDLADGGGSKPVVADIDRDGDLDVASAQYFGVKSAPIVIPPAGVNITDESFVWFERTGDTADGLGTADFTKHVIARGLGESFSIMAVDNIDGDGKYGAIGMNHTNPALPGSAAPQVVRLTPGDDIRAPWNVTRIDSGFTVDDTRTGQAAPGFGSDGDVDGDGDIDVVLSGDADGTVYWLERKADGSWAQRDLLTEFGLGDVLTANPKAYGQGSVSVADLNRDGKNEVVFSSYNSGTVEIASRKANTGGIVPSLPRTPDLFLPY